jgi:hypothetical protein
MKKGALIILLLVLPLIVSGQHLLIADFYAAEAGSNEVYAYPKGEKALNKATNKETKEHIAGSELLHPFITCLLKDIPGKHIRPTGLGVFRMRDRNYHSAKKKALSKNGWVHKVKLSENDNTYAWRVSNLSFIKNKNWYVSVRYLLCSEYNQYSFFAGPVICMNIIRKGLACQQLSLINKKVSLGFDLGYSIRLVQCYWGSILLFTNFRWTPGPKKTAIENDPDVFATLNSKNKFFTNSSRGSLLNLTIAFSFGRKKDNN